MQRFDEQRVLVLGGASGIGQAAATAFCQAGAKVTVASRNRANVDQAAAELGAKGQIVDLTVDSAVEAFFADGVVWDHIVVSIAPASSGPLRKMTLKDAYEAMDAKFWSAYRVAKAARISPEGSLIFVSGQVGKRPNANAVLQGAINAALEGLARGLALELAPTRVNVVSPGLIDTPLHSRMAEDARDALFRATAERLPVRRMGQAQDVAEAITYLAGNRFSTGAVVRVDGGSTIA